VVPRGVLLDVEVGLGNVRLGLVVVVVGDEVLDGVVGEELAQLVAELGGERLVVGDQEGRALHLLDDPGHRRRLAGAGRAEHRLVALARLEPGRKLGDRGRLVAGRLIRLGCFELRHHAKASLMVLESESPPYGAYATIMGVFAAGLAGAGGLAKIFDRNPACQTPLDLVVLSAASFKTSRTLARDEVTSFLREPFVQGRAHTGDDEEPVEGGMHQAIGELVTCSRCVGTWAAAALAVTQILAPRFGRLLTWSLAAAGANDFLQAGFTELTNR